MTEWRFWESRDQRIARAAARWHAEMLEPASAEERRSFEAWRAADPAHARAYAELDPLSALATRLPRPARERPHRAQGWRPAFGAAVIAVLVVGLGFVLVGRGTAPAFAAVTNAGPAVRVVRLVDGSIVALDAGAAISVRVGATSREVRLDAGRARFRVAADSGRPFVICARAGCARSAGGVVDLTLGASYVSIVSIRGSAELVSKASQSGNAVRLAPGAAMRVAGQSIMPLIVSRHDRLWPAARAGFDHTPLATVVADANRLGRPPIRLGDKSLASLGVTGVLDLRNTRALADKLAAALHLRVKTTPDDIVLTR